MTKPKTPGRQVMDELGYKAGPEHLERDIGGQWDLFERDGRSSAVPAFQALALIAAKGYHDAGHQDAPFGGIDPHEAIEVPWWVVWVLAGGWGNYSQADGAIPLGQAFGVDGRGQGTHPVISQLATELDNRGYALEVAALIAKGRRSFTVPGAQQRVAEKYGVSPSTVEQAWKNYRREALAKFGRSGKKLSKSLPKFR